MRPSLITAMRSLSSSSSSRSSLISKTAPPLARTCRMRAWISATAAKSSPNTGFAAINTLIEPASSRASTARCTLPPERLAIGAFSPRVFTPYSVIHERARSRHAPKRSQPRLSGASSKSRSAMFCATDSSPTQALRKGSSGSARNCRMRFSERFAAYGSPTTRTVPATRGRWPTSASTSSRWPLPETPAMPRISPLRTDRLSPCTASVPRSPIALSPSTCSAIGAAASVAVRGAALPSATMAEALAAESPIIACASCSGVVLGTEAPCTRLPRRSTVTSSA